MPIEILYRNHHCEWIDVESPVAEDLNFLHDRYNINMLLLEDTVDTNHLPKFEKDHDVKFFLMRENTELERANLNNISDISTKLSIFVVNNIIITVHRLKNRSIYEMREEVKLAENEEITADRIALHLAKKVIKSYDDESKNLIETMDRIENDIFLRNTNSTKQIRRLYKLKRKSGLNSRVLNFSTECINHFSGLQLEESEIQDLKEKHKDATTDFEHLNTQITSMIQMYLALTDQKANQVMKILAIYSMYFFPITFIAGVYGMNFDFMPELNQKYGYFITLGVMGVIALITFLYVRRKQW